MTKGKYQGLQAIGCSRVGYALGFPFQECGPNYESSEQPVVAKLAVAVELKDGNFADTASLLARWIATPSRS